MSTADTYTSSEFERLAFAIARAVHDGPTEAKKCVASDSVIVNYEGTRIQLMRFYDIQLDEFQYRCFLLNAEIAA